MYFKRWRVLYRTIEASAMDKTGSIMRVKQRGIFQFKEHILRGFQNIFQFLNGFGLWHQGRYILHFPRFIDHFRITAIWPGDRIRRPEHPTENEVLDAAVAMRVYSISAGRTLH